MLPAPALLQQSVDVTIESSNVINLLVKVFLSILTCEFMMGLVGVKVGGLALVLYSPCKHLAGFLAMTTPQDAGLHCEADL